MVTSELEMEEEDYHFAVNWQLLLLILFSAFASKVLRTLSPGACQWLTDITLRKSSLAVQLKTEITSLMDELRGISITDSFAEHARLQRRIVQKERQLEDIEKQHASRGLRRTVFLQGVCLVLIEGTRIAIIILNRYAPVVQLSRDHLWPLTSIIAFPTGIPGAVSVPCWGILSRQFIETAASLWSRNIP